MNQPRPAPAAAPLAPIASGLPPASPPETAVDWLRRRLVDLMPVILVTLLALSTMWLVHSMPDQEPAAAPPPPNDPDYYMQDFRIRSFDVQGKLVNDLRGQHGDHLPGPDILRIAQPRSFSVDQRGVETTAQADRSVSDRRGNDIQLYDNVRVVRHDTTPGPNGAARTPMTLESSYLRLINRQEHILTDKPVRITQGQDVINASSLDYRSESRVMQLGGRVSAVMQPRPN